MKASDFINLNLPAIADLVGSGSAAKLIKNPPNFKDYSPQDYVLAWAAQEAMDYSNGQLGDLLDNLRKAHISLGHDISLLSANLQD